jgi:lysophospholipase L1-like esterase
MKLRSCVGVVVYASFVAICLLTIIALQVATHSVCPPHAIDVATFGDSLTDSYSYGKQISCASWNSFGYQHYMYEALRRGGTNAVVRNFGIGGQTSSQIASRVTSALETDYLTFFMGVNDLFLWDTATKNDTVPQNVARALAQRPFVRRKRIIVATIPPYCQGYAFVNQGAPEAMNEAIWRNSTFYDVVDVYSALVMPGTNWRHPMYCFKDLLHFTDAANAVVGYMFANAILSPRVAGA